MVADFESIIEPISSDDGKTRKIANHKACAYSLKVMSDMEEWNRPPEYYEGKVTFAFAF